MVCRSHPNPEQTEIIWRLDSNFPNYRHLLLLGLALTYVLQATPFSRECNFCYLMGTISYRDNTAK